MSSWFEPYGIPLRQPLTKVFICSAFFLYLRQGGTNAVCTLSPLPYKDANGRENSIYNYCGCRKGCAETLPCLGHFAFSSLAPACNNAELRQVETLSSFSGHCCHRVCVGEWQKSELLTQRCLGPINSGLLPSCLTPGTIVWDMMRPGLWMHCGFPFFRIITWKGHWTGSSATQSLKRTVTSWLRWRTMPMQTSCPRPSLKGPESRMDLEVSPAQDIISAIMNLF